jgi:hypothetical protein
MHLRDETGRKTGRLPVSNCRFSSAVLVVSGMPSDCLTLFTPHLLHPLHPSGFDNQKRGEGQSLGTGSRNLGGEASEQNYSGRKGTGEERAAENHTPKPG